MNKVKTSFDVEIEKETSFLNNTKDYLDALINGTKKRFKKNSSKIPTKLS